jgi:hypothetical protein
MASFIMVGSRRGVRDFVSQNPLGTIDLPPLPHRKVKVGGDWIVVMLIAASRELRLVITNCTLSGLT